MKKNEGSGEKESKVTININERQFVNFIIVVIIKIGDNMKKERLKPVLSFDSITDQQWAEAMWSTAQYITYKLNGNPQTG